MTHPKTPRTIAAADEEIERLLKQNHHLRNIVEHTRCERDNAIAQRDRAIAERDEAQRKLNRISDIVDDDDDDDDDFRFPAPYAF